MKKRIFATRFLFLSETREERVGYLIRDNLRKVAQFHIS